MLSEWITTKFLFNTVRRGRGALSTADVYVCVLQPTRWAVCDEEGTAGAIGNVYALPTPGPSASSLRARVSPWAVPGDVDGSRAPEYVGLQSLVRQCRRQRQQRQEGSKVASSADDRGLGRDRDADPDVDLLPAGCSTRPCKARSAIFLAAENTLPDSFDGEGPATAAGPL